MNKLPVTTKDNTITAKQAALNAKNFFMDIVGAENVKITLEEVSLSDDKKFWSITLGIHTPTDNPVLLAQGLKELLNYKTFKIDAKSGEVISMDIKFINFPRLQNG